MKRTLLGTDLWIEQTSKQAFNLDTILLADFASVPYKTKTILDLGTGNGAIMLYLSQKSKAKIIGVEIQENRYQQALKNIEMNGLQSRCSVSLGDIKDMPYREIDMIVTNPPFFKVTEDGHLNPSMELQIARHEVMIDLKTLIESARKMLRFRGKFCMIHRPDRLIEIMSLMNKHQLEIKRLRFVHPFINEAPNHVLIEAYYQGQPGLTIDHPLILYQAQNVLSKELEDIYGGRSYVTHITKQKRKT